MTDIFTADKNKTDIINNADNKIPVDLIRDQTDIIRLRS
ncbi:hypothetical protein SDC9_138659 [bioreactor metagenome]|uniref:Uncharacterized protein n=1 Tax=bioreactor metagenome TaxID=1076179 RepID=A0A645DQW6_9ZZZZ